MDIEQIEAVRQRAICIYTENEVETALDLMAAQITALLANKNPILLCVMNGGLITTGKLATRLEFPLQLDYLHATRYRDKTSGTDLQWRASPALSLHGRAVLVIDDILDEGATLEAVVRFCEEEGAKEVLTAVLTEKAHDRKLSAISPNIVGLQLEDFYVFGYGMDYKGYWRNAAGIFAVAEQDL